MKLLGMVAAATIGLLSSTAIAGDIPLYLPSPDWVTKPKLTIDVNQPLAGGPILLDVQQRIEGGTVWTYSDTAIRLDSPEALSQSSNVTLAWNPGKGDLIIHHLTILRDGKEIDTLSSGQKFTVLRREQQLEQRELTGILSATLAVEGIRVGDVLRLGMSTTVKDSALGGRAQVFQPLVTEPMQIAQAGYKLSWGGNEPVGVKIFADKADAKRSNASGYSELSIKMPIAKQSEFPDDAPGRFFRPPIIEASTFADWADVSKAMAPHYAADGLIPAGSTIANETAAIKAATQDPLRRTAMALQLVQDKIRYLAVGMDGGNYIPQSPIKTWEVRYGDCKAKTLLLLAILKELEIEAEPVLAHSALGDVVPLRVPSALAFNHILVRATVNGETLWLDGTGLGTRLADIRDTPPLGHLLPVRAEGAQLLKIELRQPARPTIDLTVDADESTSLDLPSVASLTMIVRGELANTLILAKSRLPEKDQRDLINGMLQNFVGEAQYETLESISDPDSGSVSIKGRGVFNSGWRTQDRRSERWLSRAPQVISFDPDRARSSWSDIPVLTRPPELYRYKLRIRLPDGGTGYAIEGDKSLDTVIAGTAFKTSAVITDGVLAVEESFATSGAEIPAAQIPSEREQVATTLSRVPRLIAPADARRRWNLTGAASTSQLTAIKAIYAKARNTADEEDITPLTSSSSFLRGVGDYKGMIDVLTQQISLVPSGDAYLERAVARHEQGDLTGALRDAQEARKLDTASPSAIGAIASYTAELGDVPKAVALLDERIALGGKTRDDYRRTKAALVGEFGDPEPALADLDLLNTEKPGSPMILNERCWIKATRKVQLESALKDCTSAIELSESSAAILDSRALVWFRLGRYEDALRDLDAALLQSPGLASSRFLRAIVYKQMGRTKEAASDLAIARQMSPSVERTYMRFGINS